jgi:hypothetical protein
MIQRKTHLAPGYDCRVECPHEPKGRHGYHSDEWWFTVVDGDARTALSLRIHTTRYPASVVSVADDELFSGWDFVRHSRHAWTKHQVLSHTMDECEHLGLCHSSPMTVTYADNFAKKHLVYDAGLEQPEAFWLAMEAELASAIAYIEAARREDGDLKWKVCSCCKGQQVVPL